MVELKGIYYNDSKHSPMAVLVQFDGQLLHVWHLADPFFRLRSSSRFMIKPVKKKREKIIKFPDGACIECENTDAFDTLMENVCHSITSNRSLFLRNGTLIVIAALILILLGASWSLIN